jgi:VanZ family protein
MMRPFIAPDGAIPLRSGTNHLRLLVDERTKQILFRLWCLTWLAILVASLWPLQQMPFGLSDKLIHFAGYWAMAAAVAGFCHEARGVLRWGVLAVAIGGLVEIGQHFVPMRSMDFNDFLADTAGAVCGVLLALLWLALVVWPLRRNALA